MKCHASAPYFENGIKSWQIYVLHNTATDKWYVGQTSQGLRRIKNHFTRPHNPVIARDLRLHGLESFRYRVLDGIIPSQDRACLVETVEIVRRGTIFPRGYNFQMEIRASFKPEFYAYLERVAEKSKDFKEKGVMFPALDL